MTSALPRRLRLLAAAGLLVVGAAACGTPDDEASDPAVPSTTSTTSPTATTEDRRSTTTASTTTTAPTTTAPETTTTAPPTTTEPTPPPPEPPPDSEPAPETSVLRAGDEGQAVTEVQGRLAALGYWIGSADGTFGTLTEQAVYAFQKANGLAVDGVVGPSTRAALADPVPVQPRSDQGTAWEVDKTRQLLILAVDGEARTVWNTSTGTEAPYTHEGRQLLADTPPGRFELSWQVDGWRDGALGRMWRPKYFHPDGIAIHGYPSVPPVPASHGCVRVTMAAMDHIWATGLAPLGTPVHVYGESPV